MSEIGETWQAIKALQREDKAARRIASIAKLDAASISYSQHNDGLHLIICSAGVVFDFWPTTDKWIRRGTKKKQYGVDSLLKALKTS